MLAPEVSCRFRNRIQQKMTAARMIAAPMMEPMMIPAIAPPDSPDPAWLVGLDDGVADEVLDGKTGGIDTVVGSLRPAQRD